MKTNTLFCLSLAGITLAAAGDLRPLVNQAAAPKQIAAPETRPAEAGQLQHLSAATAGRVWEVYVQPGSPVQRGQLLAKLGVSLHTVTQQQLEAELAVAQGCEQQLLNAAPGTVSADSLAQARHRVETASQQLATTAKQVAFIFIQAPAAGVVAASLARSGSYVSASDTVVSLRITSARLLTASPN